MKLSNNAIKFLMAQYRAIYKNAYFKGIASAVVLTAGLAAGQAQAANLTDFSELTASDEIGVSGNELKLSGSSTAPWNAKLTLSGTVTGSDTNKIQASGGAVTLKGAGTFTLNAVNSGSGANFNASGSNLEIGISKIDIASGTLKIDNSGATATVYATDGITIGGGTSGATLIIGDATNSTSQSGSTVGSGDYLISLKEKGKIVLNGSGSSGAILVGKFAPKSSGGTIEASGNGTLKTSGTIDSATITIKKGKELVLENALNAPLTLTDGKLNISGSGSSGAKFTVKGNMVLGSAVTVTAGTSGDSIVVGSGASGSLTATKTQINAVLGASGQVSVGASGELFLNPEAENGIVDLNGLTLSGSAGTASFQ